MTHEIELELFVPGPELNAHKDDIWNVLEATDRDFVPPLSSREPTTLGELKPSRVVFALPIEHVEFQLGLHVIFARVNGRVVGFLSFMPDFSHEVVGELESTVLIDTVAVLPGWRRQGIGKALYRRAWQDPAFLRAQDAVLHTWSTNTSHGDLIHKLGFEEIHRIPNERAPGIDTLIYRRPTHPSPFA